MRRVLFVAAVLLSAGCISGATVEPSALPAAELLPRERFDAAELIELDVPLSDGETIHATVYLPSGAAPSARFGTILQFSPYFDLTRLGTDDLLTTNREFNQTRVGLYVGHGFAYVAASVPGTGLSSGCFEIGGEREQKRMAEFVDWIAQQDWSNGNVGMMGVSYDGTTPWEVAIQNPVALKTIVPIAGITDMYRYPYQDGAPYSYYGMNFLPEYLLLVGFGIDLYDTPPRANPRPALFLDDACVEALPQFTETYKTWSGGQYSEFWSERNFSAKIGNIQASVLLVQGLVDWNVKPDHAETIWDLIPTEKRGWFGQWPHTTPDRNRLNEEWSRPDWNATTLAWFDHYLNGVENGVPENLPAVWAQDTDGRWVTSTAWPPAEAEDLTLYLQPGTLNVEPGNAAAATILTPPEPAPGGMAFTELGPDSPPMTFAQYLTEPMEADMRLAGAPELLLHMSVDRPGPSFVVAKLYNVSADGTWWFLDEGGRGLAQRNGRDKDEAVSPGENMEVPVRMHTTTGVIHKGERLALLVAARDPSWFDFNGNAPTITLQQDAQRPSALTLRVLPADAPAGLAPDIVWTTNPLYEPGLVDGPSE